MRKSLIPLIGLALAWASLVVPAHASNVHDDLSWVTSENPVTAPDIDPGDLNTIQPLGMTPSHPGGCRFVVWEVSQNTQVNWLGARGGRDGCINYAKYKVKIMKHVPVFVDKVIAIAHGEGNSTVVATAPCDGPGIYYTRVESDTGGSFAGGERKWLCS